LQWQGYRPLGVIGYNAFREHRPDAIDMVCFVGPQRTGVWLPVVANCSTLRVSLRDWFTLNPLARHLSISARATIYLWCLDSGYAAGYSLFSQGQHQESQTVFWRGETRRPAEIMSGVPVPDYRGAMNLGNVLENSEFDY